MNKTFEKLKLILDKDMAYTTAITLINWDNETLAPVESLENTSRVIGVLSAEQYQNMKNHTVEKLLDRLETEKENKELTDTEKAIVKQCRITYHQLEPVPPEEYKELNELKAKACGIWAKARENKCYEEFEPVLKRIIELKKKSASYRKKGRQASYDVLLNDYEECFPMEKLDKFFEKIKQEIVPLLKEVVKKTDVIHKTDQTFSYEIQKQREFCKWLCGYLGFDFKKGVFAESAHPFSTNLHNKDVRITSHFYENNLESGIFSVIHEVGHALYEMNVGDELTQTIVGRGTSTGMHESQSRFFENIIGKSYEFWKPIYPKLKDTFKEQFQDISVEEFIRKINKVEPGCIRIEADELTYPLHIMVRYEIEKQIFSGKVKLKDLPELWNKKYEEYLGVKPKDDSEGILQDIHWACGDFGYFPSYAVGSAIAAQLYYHMKKTFPLEQYLLDGTIVSIREYLSSHIHQYGATKNTNELLIDITGEELNADYYIRYLKEKYSAVYDLD